MPLSTDNQDLGEKENKQPASKADSPSADKSNSPGDNKLTSDDLKGKKVDADPEKETDKPAEV